MLKELCKLLKSIKVKKIIIGESSAYDTDRAFEICGINSLKKYAEIVNFESIPKKIFIFKGEKVPLPKILFEVDLIIDFAKLKTHSFTGVTLCTKNLYGCIPGKLKELYHRKFSDIRTFSNLINFIENKVNPKLCFIDGVVGIEGEGPGASGDKVNSRVLFASKSCAAIDIIATEKMGFNSMKIYMNKNHKINKKDIVVVGSACEVNFKFKKPSMYLTSLLFFSLKLLPKSKIVADKDECKKCGICVRKCPVQALSLKPYAVCNYKKCIRCLCCAEVCPYNAIKLKEHFIKRFFIYLMKKLRKF